MPTRTQVLAVGAATILGVGATAVPASAASARRPVHPIVLRVDGPQRGSTAGAKGVGFVVGLDLHARRRADNDLLAPSAGYASVFNDPASATFKPGPAPGAPGLVVLLSTTPTMAGTPFQGPRTNLAGLFQTTGTGVLRSGLRTASATWFPGKPLFGTGKRTTLTAYLVRGTAPTQVPTSGLRRLSNTSKVRFTIGG